MNPFKLLGALKDMDKIKAEMQATAELLADERFAAGDALVQATADGQQRLVGIDISEAARAAPDLAERLLSAANTALAQSKIRAAEVMQKQMQERFGDLPGMDGVMKGLLPGS